jgi:formylglycine-generating enzyme required for sulfatase activity
MNTIEMVAIPAGEFMMGSLEEESYNDERPQHTVTVPAFFMSKYLITQTQWRTVAGWKPVDLELEVGPSYFKGDNLPVEQVSWYDAVEFCKRLSKYSGRRYRLPSEAQWEYACRAGTTTEYSFGDTITIDLANYFSDDLIKNKTTLVGKFPPNDFGLYDMHGNVWEWTKSTRCKSLKSQVTRGGSWLSDPRGCRSAYRCYSTPNLRSNNTGFRVVSQ